MYALVCLMLFLLGIHSVDKKETARNKIVEFNNTY